MARIKSLTARGGSRSFAESTSTQVISRAPLSPGEHGVSSSSPSTVTCFSWSAVEEKGRQRIRVKNGRMGEWTDG